MPIKVLLLEDVQELRSGDIVNVKPGYARNYLLPQGFAIIADKKAIRMQARLQETRLQQAVVDKKESEQLKGQLEGVVVTSTVKVDKDGHMYGSVNASDIVELLQSQAQIVVEKRSVILKQAIKDTGVHTINIKLKEGITSSFTLKIIAEEVAAEAEAASYHKSRQNNRAAQAQAKALAQAQAQGNPA